MRFIEHLLSRFDTGRHAAEAIGRKGDDYKTFIFEPSNDGWIHFIPLRTSRKVLRRARAFHRARVVHRMLRYLPKFSISVHNIVQRLLILNGSLPVVDPIPSYALGGVQLLKVFRSNRTEKASVTPVVELVAVERRRLQDQIKRDRRRATGRVSGRHPREPSVGGTPRIP